MDLVSGPSCDSMYPLEMFISELELESQLEDWFEQSCIFERVTVECYRCVVREEKRFPELVCCLQSRNEVDVEDTYLLPRIDIWMNQSFRVLCLVGSMRNLAVYGLV